MESENENLESVKHYKNVVPRLCCVQMDHAQRFECEY